MRLSYQLLIGRYILVIVSHPGAPSMYIPMLIGTYLPSAFPMPSLRARKAL